MGIRGLPPLASRRAESFCFEEDREAATARHGILSCGGLPEPSEAGCSVSVQSRAAVAVRRAGIVIEVHAHPIVFAATKEDTEPEARVRRHKHLR